MALHTDAAHPRNPAGSSSGILGAACAPLGPEPNNPLGEPAGFLERHVRWVGPEPNDPLGEPAGFLEHALVIDDVRSAALEFGSMHNADSKWMRAYNQRHQIPFETRTGEFFIFDRRRQ